MEKRSMIKFGFALIAIIAGLILNYFDIGRQDYVMFNSIGLWLVYVGFVTLIAATLQKFSKKKRQADERAQYIGNKAGRITFIILIITAFVIMIVDGVKQITVPYHTFMANLVAWLTLTYFVTFKIIEKNN